MGIKEEGPKHQTQGSIDDFYNSLQIRMLEYNEDDKLCFITSRSTEVNNEFIRQIASTVQLNCKLFGIPTEGVFLRKTELCVKAYKYLICNTNFTSQSLLANDTANGHLVDMQPPFSVYLLIEILWQCNFEDILAESILHFPLDVCLQILEVLPRCIDLLDFERATKFLSTIIPNAYKKIISLRNTGSQTQDVNEKATTFSAHTIELILQFLNSRFLKLEDVSTEEKYQRYGTLLKSIIQTVRLCFTSKSKKVEHPIEMEKLYKLNFGHAEYYKINDELLEKLLLGIDRELISLLMKKVKEIDCNIYINWTEYDDKENTAITLQRAIGLEAFFFIENTKELVSPELKEYQHLVECLGQIASKPDNSIESMQLEDLIHGVGEGKTEYLVALFRRYKEWNDSVVDTADSHISLLMKDDCESIFEYLADEIVSQTHPEKLQTCLLCLSKALVFLEITELYEITMKFILKFGDNDNLENVIDITNFERFLSLNSNLSVSKNLRVVLFFLCLKPKASLKILVKMAIGHADYPDVAISIDDLMLLEPIMRIQTHFSDDTMIDALRHKCMEKLNYTHFYKFASVPKEKLNKPYSVSMVVRVLRDICLDANEWNFTKFGNLLQALNTFCSTREFIWEIFVPLLLSDRCTPYHLHYILIEMKNIKGKLNPEDVDCKEAATAAYDALIKRGIWLLNARDISRYIVNDCQNIIEYLINYLITGGSVKPTYPSMCYRLFLSIPDKDHITPDNQYFMKCPLGHLVGLVNSSHQAMTYPLISKNDNSIPNENIVALSTEDVIRFIMTMCTKRHYLVYAREIVTSAEVIFRKFITIADRCDLIIRLTLEACLLCFEFPMVAAPDSVSFLLRCLQIFLSSMMNTPKKINIKLCKSLEVHLEIFEYTVPRTIVSEAFNELIDKCKESNNNVAVRIQAIEAFALSCTNHNDKLKTYEGPNSPLAIKLYLAYDLVCMAVDEKRSCEEEYIKKLIDFLKEPVESSER